MFNRTIVYILLVAVATGLGLGAAERYYGAGAGDAQALETVRLFPEPRTLPAFALRQSDGTQLVLGELKGHWTLVFLGYTQCRESCSTTLTALAQAQEQWQALSASTRPRILFVSVDPQRDGADRVGEYAHGFHRDSLAATADIPALEAFARSLSMSFVTVPASDDALADQYNVDHSQAIAILDPGARMAGLISPPFDPQAIARDLAILTSGAPP